MSETCFICDGEELPENLAKCSLTSYEHMKDYAEQWFQIGERVRLHGKFSTISFFVGLKNHRNCYIALTHKNNLLKAKNAFDAKQASNNNDGSALCIICQKAQKAKPSTVTTLKEANDILGLTEISANYDLIIRLSSLKDPMDVIKKEIKYHKKCLNNQLKKTLKKSDRECVNNYHELDSEFVEAVRLELTSLGDRSPIIDMKQLVEMYENFLQMKQLPSPVKLLKPYIKTLLQADQQLMSQIDFYHCDPCKPTVIANKLFVAKLICDEHFCGKKSDEIKIVKNIRKEVGALKPWEFHGAFDNFDLPPKLFGLIKLIIAGEKSLDEIKQKEIDVICSNITQYICSNFKSDRQLLYKSNKNRGFEKHRLTPLSVGTALSNYQQNKSKAEINALSSIGLSINYDHVERIVTGIAETLIHEASKNELGIILPSCIKKGIRPVFAADNIDLGSDAGSFHGADLMIVQRNDPEGESLFPEIFFTKSQKRSLKSSIAPEIDENVELTDGNDTNYKTPIEVKKSSEYWKKFQQLNMIWLFLSNTRFFTPTKQISRNLEMLQNSGDDDEIFVSESTNDIDHDELDDNPNESNDPSGPNESENQKEKADKLLSWSAFHSNIAEPPDVLSNVAIVAPLYRRSPTEVPILIDILKRAMNITVLLVGPGKKTLITLDGDLWTRAVKIPNYKDKWIIRLGSLHMIIAALKCLGKYIEGSGIDTAWEMSGMFGSATVNQVIEGRHIYRGIQAHTITLMALHYLYAKTIFTDDEKRDIDSTISNLKTEIFADIDKTSFINAINKAQEDFESQKVFEKLEVKNSSGPTAKFLYNYMMQVSNLLNNIGATRIRHWRQHLGTSDDMCKYFHAHDQSNYCKFATKYVADMLELESTDKESWDFLEAGNFCVSKNEIPFTSIDPDHAIEHEHKPFKTKGGFIGITGDESALERFVLTMPILSDIAERFKRSSSVKPSGYKREEHHESIGNFFENQLKHSQNLINTLTKEGNPFEYPDLRNLVNYSVPSNTICKNVLNRDKLGIKFLKTFREERMMENSTTPFWSTLPRNNLKMFSDTEIKVNNSQKLVTSIRKEKQLYARMLAISRTRPELCPDKVIGDYEFTNIPPSNFMPDGRMITAKAKSNASLIGLIKKMPRPESDSREQVEVEHESVVIIDARDLLNDIKKKKSIHKVSDLANMFVSQLTTISNKYSEVRLVFHPFVKNSLKESVDQKSNSLQKVPIYYHAANSTPIKNIENFLAHVNTRIELATFLAKKALKHFQGSNIKFLVAYENKFAANCPLADICSMNLETGIHKLEETNHLILLNAVDVAQTNSNRNLMIKATNTDVVVQLIDFYKSIPPITTVNISGQLVNIGDLHSRLGDKYSKALFGWYAFQGMENCGSFRGKAIGTQFKTFKKCDDEILSAFSTFGITPQIPESTIVQMERFVCLLYGKGDKNIKELRYLMSVKDGKDANQLPPTIGTLIPHMFRAYYLTLQGKMSIYPQLNTPDPTNYHWVFTSDKVYEPIMCIKPASPFDLLDLKSCNCKSEKKPCSTLSCKCLNNGLECCDFCECGDNCKNPPTKKYESEDDGDVPI